MVGGWRYQLVRKVDDGVDIASIQHDSVCVTRLRLPSRQDTFMPMLFCARYKRSAACRTLGHAQALSLGHALRRVQEQDEHITNGHETRDKEQMTARGSVE